MRKNSDNLSKNYEQFRNSQNTSSLIYIFEIKLECGDILMLNSSGIDIFIENQKFTGESGLNLVKGEFNDSAENTIILHGIFNKNAIDKSMNLAACSIKIYHYTENTLFPIVTYFITEFEKNDLDFYITCQPETLKYNQSILLLFSKTCRANFGDRKCSIDINQYKKLYEIESIKSKIITLTNIEVNNGYYNLGYASFENEFQKIIKFKIISHKGRTIELENNIASDFIDYKFVTLMPSCDKNFITCCNKFNNAVNFRGEPTMDEHNFLKNNG